MYESTRDASSSAVSSWQVLKTWSWGSSQNETGQYQKIDPSYPIDYTDYTIKIKYTVIGHEGRTGWLSQNLVFGSRKASMLSEDGDPDNRFPLYDENGDIVSYLTITTDACDDSTMMIPAGEAGYDEISMLTEYHLGRSKSFVNVYSNMDSSSENYDDAILTKYLERLANLEAFKTKIDGGMPFGLNTKDLKDELARIIPEFS